MTIRRRDWTRAAQCFTGRRDFLLAGGSLAILPLVNQLSYGRLNRHPRFHVDPFQMGVASGDPTSTGVVLWTRLAPNPTEPNGGLIEEAVEVQWEIASDESMNQIVQKGRVPATAALGYSVHIEVEGLSPDRWYFYRFHCGDATSPIGRTRTMPSIDSMPDRLQFAFASCQHYETGYYTAYEHMGREPLDLILHLGDYIYEGAGKEGRLRQHSGSEITSLNDYRARYGQYKSDTNLKEAHRIAPWLVVWDDHEFDNNYANLISEEPNVAAEEFAIRRANAYQAYYENMPLRSTSMPKEHHMQLYRRVCFGQLAQFDMLDTRQYRTDQPNGDGSKELTGDVFNPQATLLGDEQEKWLFAGLIKSEATWNILGQQIMMARADRASGPDRKFSMDQWSGYEIARNRLLQFLHDHQKKNTVVLTGDIHNNWANNLHIDFDSPSGQPVATEFVGTSISSGGNGVDQPKYLDSLYSENPFVKFHNNERGYVSCEVTPTTWKTRFQTIAYVDKPGSELTTRGTFFVEKDKPGIQR